MQGNPSILDSISTGILGLDSLLRVSYINTAAQSLLEISESRSIGMPAAQLVQHNTEWLRNLVQTLESNTPQTRREIPLVLHSGQEVKVDLSISVHESGTGERGLVVELHPIDRLLRITRDEGLLMAQETTRTVLRSLAHEIKNPLGGVRGAAQLLARELPEQRLQEYTNIIIREADRLRDLVDRLLGPNQQPDITMLNIHEVLEQVRELIQAEAGAELAMPRDYDPSLPQLPGDRGLLVQALLNVMRNACQALHGAGIKQPQISVRTRSQRQFTIGARRHKLVCRVEICDNGPGVPPELLHSIFVPMISGRADGTGLGLSIAQSIINRHGGLLECHSAPGDTKFTIYLPMEQEHA